MMLVTMQAPPISSGSAIIGISKSPSPLSSSAVRTMVAPTVTT